MHARIYLEQEVGPHAKDAKLAKEAIDLQLRIPRAPRHIWVKLRLALLAPHLFMILYFPSRAEVFPRRRYYERVLGCSPP